MGPTKALSFTPEWLEHSWTSHKRAHTDTCIGSSTITWATQYGDRRQPIWSYLLPLTYIDGSHLNVPPCACIWILANEVTPPHIGTPCIEGVRHHLKKNQVTFFRPVEWRGTTLLVEAKVPWYRVLNCAQLCSWILKGRLTRKSTVFGPLELSRNYGEVF